MQHKCAIVVTLCFVFVSSDVLAAAVMQRRLEQQKQMQEQAVRAAYEQAMAQKQAQEAVAYQQAMAQRQAIMQQQAAYQKAALEYAAYKKAMQEAVAKRNAEIQAAQQIRQAIAQRQAERAAYGQAVAQKQMAEVVAYKKAVAQRQIAQEKVQLEVNAQVKEYAQYLTARKAALAGQAGIAQQAALGRKVVQDAVVAKARAAQYAQAAQNKVAQESVSKSVLGQALAREVMSKNADQVAKESGPLGGASSDSTTETLVGLKDLWASLDQTSVAWSQIVDDEIKLLTVSEYIDRFKKLKIKISKAPGHYVGLINALALDVPDYLSPPFMSVLTYAAIMEYDFESGANKDDLARHLLGPERYESNRKRLFGR